MEGPSAPWFTPHEQGYIYLNSPVFKRMREHDEERCSQAPSRQRQKQIRNREAGLCECCSNKATARCSKHEFQRIVTDNPKWFRDWLKQKIEEAVK